MSTGVAGLAKGLPSNLSEELKALVLMTPYDGASDSVALAARELFSQHLKNESCVRDVFFSSEPTDPNESAITGDSGFDFQGFAIAYISAAIGKVKSYNFGGMVNEQGSLDYMTNRMTSDAWKKLGLELYTILFPGQVKCGQYSFQYFMSSDSTNWGQQLLNIVTSDPFLNTHVSAVIHNQWPDMQRQVNIIFFKLYLLGGQSLVDPVVNKWKSALQDKISEDWNTFDYLNGSKPMNIDAIVGNVQSAIQQVVTTQIPATPSQGGPGAFPRSGYTVKTYGGAVVTFVNQWSKSIGIATGKQPNNTVQIGDSGGNSFGCFVEGTKVYLSNGKDVNIEDVQEGMKVLSHGGTISTRTKEDVANLMPEGETIYGFNQENAFFSAGHAFWTTEGWKAISPDITQEENPDLLVGTLQVGDIVFRIAQFSPPLYKPMVIRSFTTKKLDIATAMYGLHLIGHKSYHANGYVVVMNYPVLTQRRFSEGIAKLNPEEKARLATALNTVVPELSKTLGAFIPPVLGKAGLLHASPKT